MASAASQLMRQLTSLHGLTAILLLYTCFGALVIMTLENSHLPPKRRGLNPDQVDTNFLYKLYEIRTSKLVSREDFVEASKKQIAKWQGIRSELQWSFNTAFLYCFTLHTTIGYGHVHPSSLSGKWFSVFYAFLGIPLFLVYAGRLGACLQRRLRERLMPKSPKASGDEELPLPVTAGLLAGHSLLGAILFAATERWSLADGVYFSLISVTSVGLGDLVPGQESSTHLAASVLHLTVGVSLCSLVVNRLNAIVDRVLAEPVKEKAG